MIVLREALVNAIVHRDYSILGSDIKFAIFDDRIEVTSPGCLPNSLDIDELGTGRSEVRNRLIVSMFREMQFIEQWGTGTEKMFKVCEEYGLKKPLFKEQGVSLKVCFERSAKGVPATDQETKQTDQEVNSNNSTSELILQLIEANASITKDELANLIGVSGSAIKKHLANLKSEGLLDRVGSTKAGYWKLL